MGVRNKRPDLNGILVIDKPLGWTSADVVRLVRKRTGGAKVGHGGTLDPLATGVLVLCLGKATKEVDRVMDGEKSYTAEVDLSSFTATDDAEGEREEVAVAPESRPTRERIERVLAERFAGEIMQTPPAYSAVKVEGERAYRLARSGETPVLRARPVVVHEIGIVEYAWPRLVLKVRCGKGTYIRSLARDLGRALGTGGMLTGLRRTAVGAFTIERARPVDGLPERIEAGELEPPAAG